MHPTLSSNVLFVPHSPTEGGGEEGESKENHWFLFSSVTIRYILGPVYTVRQRQCYNVASNIALIKLLNFLKK